MKIKDIRPNPFKKFINDGKLNEEQVERLKESIEHGTLPKRFTVRKTGDGCELIFGHHRLEAYKQTKGGDFDVDIDVMDYTDEQMLIDMVRENLLQRNTEFHDEEDAVVLAREWLQSGATAVNYFYSHLKDGRKSPPQNQPVAGSSRDVASFLSKQGKAISHMKVSGILKIHDNLDPDLLMKVKKFHGIEAKDDEENITIKQAEALSRIDKDEQKDVLDAIKKSREKHQEDYVKNIAAFRDASDEVKEQVRDGTIDIADISWQKDAIHAPFTPQTSKSQVTKLMKKVMEWKKLTEEINGEMEFLIDNAHLTGEQRGKFLLIVKGISVSFLSKLLEWLGSEECSE